MNAIQHTAASALFAVCLSSGCAQSPKTTAPPIAIRPSVTVFPIQMGGQPQTDVAEVVALFLEQGGIEGMDAVPDVFTPAPDATFDELCGSFADFVRTRDLTTEYALYGAFVGGPRRGVDEIHAVLVDRAGTVVWSERQTGESSAMKKAKPRDPMSCSMFLAKRLVGPLDLNDPPLDDTPDGVMAKRWQAKSMTPDDSEFEAIETRLGQLRAAAPDATVLIYPARHHDAWSRDCATRLADAINQRGLLQARVAPDILPFEVKQDRNQQLVLWSAARSLRELVQQHESIDTDYVLVTDFMVTEGAPAARAVHTFLLEPDGDWVIIDFQNSHHTAFNRIAPTSLEQCCDLTVARLDHYLGG